MSMSGAARLAGVMGWPVSHSLSPRLHGFWLQKYGIDGAYVPLAVSPDNFPEALRALPKLGFRGVNVTVPHKEAALREADQATPRARRVGAANTLVVEEDGSLTADNTDGFGFIENLRQGAPGWNPATGPVVLVGAGGAARGIIAALQDAGVQEIRLLNRTPERAGQLADSLQHPGCSLQALPWEQRHDCLDGAALLVNSTTQGMHGNPPLDLSLDALPRSAVVTDIVYVPLMTDLLLRAQQRGNPLVDGIGMLLHQARPGFAAWFGQQPEVDDALRSFMLGFTGK